MRAIMVVVVDKLRQHPSEVALVDRNHVVEALLAGGPHPTLGDRVRARRPNRWRRLLIARADARLPKSAPQTRSRSWIRCPGLRSQGVASISCLQTHTAVGWAVTSK